jgi:putative glycosyl hydrolase-like family 6 (GHL6) protein
MMPSRASSWRPLSFAAAALVLLVAGAVRVASSERQTAPAARSTDDRWWKREPIRFLQTNLSENDSTADPRALVAAVAGFGANTFLMNMGGIVAQYPTKVPFHYPSAFLPPGRDLFGDVVREAHARKIRVIGRFDLSKTQRPVFDAHPEWFFRGANGEPVIYNGLYSSCINGNYYREHALTILAEALDRYEVDGLFFNMFGNPTADYSGVPTGPCQCQACQTRYRARYGRPVPAAADADYRAFMADSSREVAATIAELIHRKRPNAAFLTYIQDHTDGIMSESNTAVGRALPMWPYSASDNVSRSLGSEPDKVAINLAMSFIDFPWRYAHVPQPEIALRLYQNLAHGAPPAAVVSGPLPQADRSGLLAAKPVFDWHARHEDLYVGQKNAARVLLLATGDTVSYRGFFRVLTEEHLPFEVSENRRWMEDGSRFDLVIAPEAAPAELERYVREGGRLLVAGATPPPVPVGTIAGRKSTQGYWRIHDRAVLPSLKNTDLIFLDGEYLEIAPLAHPILTLIPTAMFGPPEKVWSDKVETTVPGLVLANHGKGQVAYIPWDIGSLYYRHSSEPHRGLIADLIDRLLPAGRQLTTNAHPLVEMTMMDQPDRRRTQIHLVNGTGHHDTAYFPPLEIRDIRIDLARDVRRARAVALNQDLPISVNGRFRSFTLPLLRGYEVIVLE